MAGSVQCKPILVDIFPRQTVEIRCDDIQEPAGAQKARCAAKEQGGVVYVLNRVHRHDGVEGPLRYLRRFDTSWPYLRARSTRRPSCRDWIRFNSVNFPP